MGIASSILVPFFILATSYFAESRPI